MPGMLDRGKQIASAIDLAVEYGGEIDKMDAADRKAAMTDLLPTLEKLVDIDALHVFNEKCRKWIDAHPQP